MSVARLAALVARGGASFGQSGAPDTGQPGAPRARPPFDPIAALEAATLLPAAAMAALPAWRPAPLPTLSGAAPLPEMQVPAMQAVPAAERMMPPAHEPWTATPDAGPPLAGTGPAPSPPALPSARPTGSASHPGPMPRVMPATDAPADADTIAAASLLHRLAGQAPVSLASVSLAQGVAPVQVLPAAGVSAAEPRLNGPEATARREVAAVIAAALPPRQDDAALRTTAAMPPFPALEIAPAEPAPTISIGRLEVVVAPPVREPARQPPSRAPRRGFDAYAAIRAARDRAW